MDSDNTGGMLIAPRGQDVYFHSIPQGDGHFKFNKGILVGDIIGLSNAPHSLNVKLGETTRSIASLIMQTDDLELRCDNFTTHDL